MREEAIRRARDGEQRGASWANCGSRPPPQQFVRVRVTNKGVQKGQRMTPQLLRWALNIFDGRASMYVALKQKLKIAAGGWILFVTSIRSSSLWILCGVFPYSP